MTRKTFRKLSNEKPPASLWKFFNMSSHYKAQHFALTKRDTAPLLTPCCVSHWVYFPPTLLWNSCNSVSALAYESEHHRAAYDPTFSLRAKCSQQRRAADVHVRCCLPQRRRVSAAVQVEVWCCAGWCMCVCVCVYCWADASLHTSERAAPPSIIIIIIC